MIIPFSKVDCSGDELAYVSDVLQSGWLTTGSKCAEFEDRFSEIVGAKFACAVNSATSGLHLACDAIGIGPGDKVLVPTMTFTASAEVIRYVGADPVFLDVESGTNLVAPETVAAAAKKHPGAKALMLVHFGGQAADMDGILRVCGEHGLRLIHDAAHAFPARHGKKMIGSFPDVTCFSFYANKTITTGEGGMLVTDDEDIYRRVKTMRLHGINRDVWERFTAKAASWEYDVVAPGYKYNLPDLNAAIGLAQLGRAEQFRCRRQRCAQLYYHRLSNIAGISLPVCRGHLEDHAWHLFWIVLDRINRVPRNRCIELLDAAGIGVSVHYKPLHRMSYYKERYNLNAEDYPNAERHWQGCVSLPLYPSLSDAEVLYICETIKRVISSP